ncbi:hypothetical protein C4J93_0238 [Pseudomonas sp. R2-37-08W]|nr:hypothetical protein C4J93_0238 [Pseudomonas sp. R2-37-08W]
MRGGGRRVKRSAGDQGNTRRFRKFPTSQISQWRSKCGRGLAPDGSGSAKDTSTDTPSSGASPLPHF